MGRIIKKSVKLRYKHDEIEFLKTYYPYIHNEDLSLMMGRTSVSIGVAASKLNIKKCKGFLSLNMRRVSEIGRIKSPFRSTCFKKGFTPWNKGKHLSPEHRARLVESSYVKGNIPYNYKPIGTLRNLGQYIEIKVDHGRWLSLARHNWEQVHGPVPKGYVVFRMDGKIDNNNLDNLCLMSRGELAVLNRWISRVPPELREVQQLVNQIKRIANETHKRRSSNISGSNGGV
jgi:hypothetical protein